MSGQPNLKSRLGQVRGLGSAKEGAAHWWAQRLTAIALVPLTFWFVASLAGLWGASHAEVVAWMRGPIAPVMLIALLVAGLHHFQLGMQVVIEDYVHTECTKIAGIVLVKFAAVALAAAGVFSVLKIALAG